MSAFLIRLAYYLTTTYLLEKFMDRKIILLIGIVLVALVAIGAAFIPADTKTQIMATVATVINSTREAGTMVCDNLSEADRKELIEWGRKEFGDMYPAEGLCERFNLFTAPAP